MARVIICLFLTLAFAFGSYTSFMSSDYPALKRWMTYYKEYKELQGALDKGNASKEEMLDKLPAFMTAATATAATMSLPIPKSHLIRRFAVKNRQKIPAATIQDPGPNHPIVPSFTIIIARQTKKISNSSLFLFINKE